MSQLGEVTGPSLFLVPCQTGDCGGGLLAAGVQERLRGVLDSGGEERRTVDRGGGMWAVGGWGRGGG